MGTHSLLLKDAFFDAIQDKAIEKHDYFGVCVLESNLVPSEEEPDQIIQARKLEAQLRNTYQ